MKKYLPLLLLGGGVAGSEVGVADDGGNPAAAPTRNLSQLRGDTSRRAAGTDATVDGRSLALVSAGCAGSTAAIEFTRHLLKAHGVHVEGGFTEILKPETNRFWDAALEKLKYGPEYDGDNRQLKHNSNPLDASEEYPYQDIIIKAMEESIDYAASHGRKLLFKAPPGFLDGSKSTVKYGDGGVGTAKVATGLVEMGVAFRHHYRSNALDLAICTVRDCFAGGGDRMYPVFANNGTRVDDLCMHRRTENVKVMVKFADTEHLIRKLYLQEEMVEMEKEFVRTLPGATEAFAIEDLFAFEYTDDEDVFVKSRDAWMRFLSSTIEPDEETVTNYLRMYQGKLTLKPHSVAVYNIDEVAEALRNADPPLDHYLRL